MFSIYETRAGIFLRLRFFIKLCEEFSFPALSAAFHTFISNTLFLISQAKKTKPPIYFLVNQNNKRSKRRNLSRNRGEYKRIYKGKNKNKRGGEDGLLENG
jgi:hypothetical protein